IFFILKESDSLETKFLTDALSRSEEIWIGLCFLIHFKDFISRKRSVDIYEVIDFTNMVGMFDFNFETFILGFSKIGWREIGCRYAAHIRNTLRQNEHIVSFFIK